MLVTIGSERTSDIDRRLACALAAIAGGVNTMAFQAVGFFAANMTGNVSAVSNHWARGDWLMGAFYLTIIGCFVFGAALSGLLINAGTRRRIGGVYAWTILTEAVLMAVLGALELLISAHDFGRVLVLSLSFLMGLQNAVVTRISDARVRTTHVSGMATDMGIDLAMLIDVARGREPPLAAPSNWSRLHLHSQTIASFLAGGALGVLLYETAPSLLLFVASGLLFVIGLSGLRQAKNSRIAESAGASIRSVR